MNTTQNTTQNTTTNTTAADDVHKVRPLVEALPEWTGAIIEGAGGGRIQATAEGVTYTAAKAIYRDGMWYGAWRTARGGTGIQFSSSSITPGTWQVADQ